MPVPRWHMGAKRPHTCPSTENTAAIKAGGWTAQVATQKGVRPHKCEQRAAKEAGGWTTQVPNPRCPTTQVWTQKLPKGRWADHEGTKTHCVRPHGCAHRRLPEGRCVDYTSTKTHGVRPHGCEHENLPKGRRVDHTDTTVFDHTGENAKICQKAGGWTTHVPKPTVSTTGRTPKAAKEVGGWTTQVSKPQKVFDHTGANTENCERSKWADHTGTNSHKFGHTGTNFG